MSFSLVSRFSPLVSLSLLTFFTSYLDERLFSSVPGLTMSVHHGASSLTSGCMQSWGAAPKTPQTCFSCPRQSTSGSISAL